MMNTSGNPAYENLTFNLEALPLPLAILQADGLILASNARWREAYAKQCQTGQNFLDQLAAQGLMTTKLEELRAALQAACAPPAFHACLELAMPGANPQYWWRASLSTLVGQPCLALLHLEDRSLEQRTLQATQLAALVFTHSTQAILVSDSRNKIIAINPGYTALTGYHAEEVLGKDPGFSRATRHDADFYRLLWHQIKTLGHWQGEMWNCKKDGSEYAEWITINAILGDDGAAQYYIALFSDITTQKLQREAHWQQANFDALTGLPNRRLLQDRLDTELRKAHRKANMVALFFIDLDHFKQVNDQYGHTAGDLLLKAAAQRITSCVRESDTVARLGGDEFVVLMGDFANPASLEHVAESILDELNTPFLLQHEEYEWQAQVSGSIGIALYPHDANNAQDLLQHADKAMYHAKQSGKNQFCYYLPESEDTHGNP